MNLISRKEAKEQGYNRYYTGKPCKYGHVSERDVFTASCMECRRGWEQTYRDTNKDTETYKIRNKENAKRYYRNNKEEQLANRREYYIANRNRIEAYRRQYYIDNRDKCIDAINKRYAAKMQRMPIWADRLEIAKIYRECRRITKETGVVHHVDHYYPLQGETVCGLHVHFNLQIITKEENLQKLNKHPDDFYGKQISREDCSTSDAQGSETNQASKAEEGLCISGFES